MATQEFFSIDDIETVKEQLRNMPDMNKQRMTKRQALDEMKRELLELAVNKGYKTDEIKSVLAELGITVSVKMINDIILENKEQKKTRKSNKKINKNNTQSLSLELNTLQTNSNEIEE
ncbi:molybdopterin-guanine dinucleotide biosynthesis protein MobC [Xenorhabdus sp. TS4]|uniref:molybdopterin-guanine dinucleotide biosynthesis protein MobC n=1 Tax=Xenorhabdus sp. TS4 TaxID=1873483 RepID=UPI00165712C3|nr:molybdopterin-guanine dinucleotide biosynthesis protein MobC [Xenorhabdus sp. TS4]MBC8950095.1 hypothetical protein [Xenorhabdus sp. TS4]